MNDHLILFAKNPFEDNCKTRLAVGVGKEAAMGIYARLLYETLFKLLLPKLDIKITLSMSSLKGKVFFYEAFPELNITHQCHGNLGIRIQNAFRSAFNNDADRAILIGTDLPGINWEIIHEAFQQISEHTVVLGTRR